MKFLACSDTHLAKLKLHFFCWSKLELKCLVKRLCESRVCPHLDGKRWEKTRLGICVARVSVSVRKILRTLKANVKSGENTLLQPSPLLHILIGQTLALMQTFFTAWKAPSVRHFFSSVLSVKRGPLLSFHVISRPFVPFVAFTRQRISLVL